MATTINITVSGYKETNEALNGIAEDLKNFNAPLMSSGDYYLSEIEENFLTEGKTFGEPWIPLSKRTIADKERLKNKGLAIETDKPLVRTGFMSGNFFYNIFGKNRLSLDTKASYADMHQTGIGVPKRIMTKVDDRRLNKVVNIFTEYVRDIINEHFHK